MRLHFGGGRGWAARIEVQNDGGRQREMTVWRDREEPNGDSKLGSKSAGKRREKGQNKANVTLGNNAKISTISGLSTLL